MNTNYACPPASRLAAELNVSMDTAVQLRALIKGRIDPATFETVRTWIGQCHNEPAHIEKVLCAANELIDGFGIEVIRSSKIWSHYWCDTRFVYINAGDVYAPTLVFNTVAQTFCISCMADLADRFATANDLT
jgi:hypothetical protein